MLYLIALLMIGSLAMEQDKPNVVIILVDDMGFSDIGCYGSEIDTPHIDALTKNGLRYTQFYNTRRCCPTRAVVSLGIQRRIASRPCPNEKIRPA